MNARYEHLRCTYKLCFMTMFIFLFKTMFVLKTILKLKLLCFSYNIQYDNLFHNDNNVIVIWQELSYNWLISESNYVNRSSSYMIDISIFPIEHPVFPMVISVPEIGFWKFTEIHMLLCLIDFTVEWNFCPDTWLYHYCF